MYAAFVTIILIPFFMIRRLSTIAIFSAIVLVVTIFAMSVCIYYGDVFIKSDNAQTKEMYNMTIPAS